MIEVKNGDKIVAKIKTQPGNARPLQRFIKELNRAAGTPGRVYFVTSKFDKMATKPIAKKAAAKPAATKKPAAKKAPTATVKAITPREIRRKIFKGDSGAPLTAQKALEDIEAIGFTCEAGPLSNAVAWRSLKSIVSPGYINLDSITEANIEANKPEEHLEGVAQTVVSMLRGLTPEAQNKVIACILRNITATRTDVVERKAQSLNYEAGLQKELLGILETVGNRNDQRMAPGMERS